MRTTVTSMHTDVWFLVDKLTNLAWREVVEWCKGHIAAGEVFKWLFSSCVCWRAISWQEWTFSVFVVAEFTGHIHRRNSTGGSVNADTRTNTTASGLWPLTPVLTPLTIWTGKKVFLEGGLITVLHWKKRGVGWMASGEESGGGGPAPYKPQSVSVCKYKWVPVCPVRIWIIWFPG